MKTAAVDGSAALSTAPPVPAPPRRTHPARPARTANPARPPHPARRPAEVFPVWPPAQRAVADRAAGQVPSVATLRACGFLPHARAERIAAWYAAPPAVGAGELEAAYDALAHEAVALGRLVGTPPAKGGLGVRVTLVETVEEPYADAAELCRDVRLHRAMKLRAAAADAHHPLLPDVAVDQLRVVHDVLGHTALGLGFDLQSEYAAWLWCRPLFSPAARAAAFCELVGRVTAYVLTGTKPAYRAALPPARFEVGELVGFSAAATGRLLPA